MRLTSHINLYLLCGWLSLSVSVVASREISAVSTDLQQQAWRDLQILASDAMQGRAPGSQGSLYAQDYLQFRYQQLGLLPLGDSYLLPFNQSTGWRGTAGVNIAGVRQGCVHPQQFIVVTAHYDHLAPKGRQIYNGADDNASGVAGMLYLAALSAQSCPAYSQLFLATDAEETGLAGAKAFLQAALLDNQQIMVNLNLDMISRGERAQKLYLLSSRKLAFVRQWAQQRPQQQQVRLQRVNEGQRLGAGLAAERVNWANASDHAPFRRAGIPYLYFGVGLHQHYHTPDDDWQQISPVFFQSALQLIADGWQLTDKQLPVNLRPELYQPKSN